VSGDERVRVVGTTQGTQHRPHLLEAWGLRFNVQVDDHVTLFRYSDVPGMVGRVGTLLGDHGINISNAAVGRQPEGAGAGDGLAAMVVTTDDPVPREVVDEIVASDGFVEGHTVGLVSG
jgi:D-3-phosphoglycerate dehydrogenase